MLHGSLPDIFRNKGLCIIHKRGDIILRGAKTSSLVIYVPWFAVTYHYIRCLKVAEKKILLAGIKEKTGKCFKITFQSYLVEGSSDKLEEHIFVIVQIPDDALPVKAFMRVAKSQVKSFDALCLYPD